MEQIKHALKDPDLVVAFQKFCGVDSPIWRQNNNRHVAGDYTQNGKMAANGACPKGTENASLHQNGTCLPHNGHSNGNSEVRERLLHKNGVNGHISNGHSCAVKNGFVHPPEINPHDSSGDSGKTTCQNGGKPSPKTDSITNEKVSMMAELLNDTLGQELRTDSEVEFTVHNKFLYYLFSIGANLGNEAFYIIFFPCLLWNIDGWVARRMLYFWCLYMYIGQATKDLLKIPRPPSPPVVRIERRYALEYGMPSTHAMTGLGMPFTILYLLHGRYEVSL